MTFLIVLRYCKKTKKYIHVNCRYKVKIYNQDMGGVDLLEYIPPLYHLLDIAVTNSYLLAVQKSQEAEWDADPVQTEALQV